MNEKKLGEHLYRKITEDIHTAFGLPASTFTDQPTAFNQEALDKMISLIESLPPAPDWIECINFHKDDESKLLDWLKENNISHFRSYDDMPPGMLFLQSVFIRMSAGVPVGTLFIEHKSGKLSMVKI